jgi:hypothetical protein
MNPIPTIANHAAGPSKPVWLAAAVGFAIVLAGALLLAAMLGDEPMDGSTLFKPTNDLRLLLDVAMPALRAFIESVARRLLEDAADALEAVAASGTAALAIVAPSLLPVPSRKPAASDAPSAATTSNGRTDRRSILRRSIDRLDP